MNNPADIRQIILSEFRSYEQAFAAALQSDNQLLSQVLDYIHSKRGKQLRPILVLLSAALCRGVTDKTIQTAVALELMHTASLVHDDVVDDTPTRRGSNAVHTQWSNKIAIRDVWRQQDVAEIGPRDRYEQEVAPHGAALLLVSPPNTLEKIVHKPYIIKR